MEFNYTELDKSVRFEKIMSLLVGFLLVMVQLILIIYGTMVLAFIDDYSPFLDVELQTPALMIIAFGLLLLSIVLFGVYATCKESVLLINMYGLALFGVFLLEVCAAIAAYMMQDNFHQILNTTMTELFAQYQENEYIRKSFDYLQLSLGCCGVTGPSNWYLLNLRVLPDSCCLDLACSQVGCLRRLEFIIKQSLMLLATGASTVAFVQLSGAICAFMLGQTLRRNKSLRLVRRWQMEQILGILTTTEKCPTESSIGVGTHGSDSNQQLEMAGAYADHSRVA